MDDSPNKISTQKRRDIIKTLAQSAVQGADSQNVKFVGSFIVFALEALTLAVLEVAESIDTSKIPRV